MPEDAKARAGTSKWPRPYQPEGTAISEGLLSEENSKFVEEQKRRDEQQREERSRIVPEAIAAVKKGQQCFERGRFSQAIAEFQKALTLVKRNSDLGGEASIWLGMAYQATNKDAEAKKIFRLLTVHPNDKHRRVGRDLLEIMNSPNLGEIPPAYKVPIIRKGQSADVFKQLDIPPPTSRWVRNQRKKDEWRFEDLSQMNTKDNQFIVFALLLALIYLAGIAYL